MPHTQARLGFMRAIAHGEATKSRHVPLRSLSTPQCFQRLSRSATLTIFVSMSTVDVSHQPSLRSGLLFGAAPPPPSGVTDLHTTSRPSQFSSAFSPDGGFSQSINCYVYVAPVMTHQ